MKKNAEKTVLIAGANIITNRKNEILLVQEMPKEEYKEIGGKWNFPGGKQEPGENLEHCAEREGNEETGLDIKVSSLVGKYEEDIPAHRIKIVMHVFKAEVVGGKIKRPADIKDIKWFSIKEIENLNKKGLLLFNYIWRAIQDLSKA